MPIIASNIGTSAQPEGKHTRIQSKQQIVDLVEKGNEAGSSEMEINNDNIEQLDDAHLHLQLPSDKDIKSNSSINNRLPTGKTSHATQAISKQFSNEQEQQSSEAEDILEGVIEHLIDESVPDEIIPNYAENLEISERTTLSDCWEISTCVVGGKLNTTIGMEDFCPSKGKSLNLTLSIPLSRYFKEPTLEINFR